MDNPLNNLPKRHPNHKIADLAESAFEIEVNKFDFFIIQTKDETDRRREKQISYNKKNNITPTTIISKISDVLAELNNKNGSEENKNSQNFGKNIKQSINELQLEMQKAASNLDFEEAAKLRDELKRLQQRELGLMTAPKEKSKYKSFKKR